MTVFTLLCACMLSASPSVASFVPSYLQLK